LERQGIEVSREDSVVRRPRLHDKWRQVCARPSCRETVGKEGELFCYRHRRNKDEWAKQKARRDAERLANPPPPRPQPKARSENVPRSPLLSIAPPDQKYVSTSNKSRFSRTRQLQVIQKPPPCPGREDGYHMMDVWLTDDGIQIQQCRCCPHHREHDYREVTF
jgi:hypothetical protein